MVLSSSSPRLQANLLGPGIMACVEGEESHLVRASTGYTRSIAAMVALKVSKVVLVFDSCFEHPSLAARHGPIFSSGTCYRWRSSVATHGLYWGDQWTMLLSLGYVPYGSSSAPLDDLLTIIPATGR